MVPSLKATAVVTLWFSFAVLGTFSEESVANNAAECTADSSGGTCEQSGGSGNATLPSLSEDCVDECVDTHENCERWAAAGHCNEQQEFMLNRCMKSCKVCGDDIEDVPVDSSPCVDSHQNCPGWKRQNQCEKNPGYMLFNCRKSCKACETSITSTIDFGVKQKEGGENATKIAAVIRESKKYMRKIMSDPAFANVRETCRNGNEMCSAWAAEGQCQRSSTTMKFQCAPACQSCELLDVDKRCKVDPDAKDALGPKGLHRMFERIVDEEEFKQYNVSIISRPYQSGETRERYWKLGPWFLSFENFLTDEEADRLIEHGYKRGFGRSEQLTKSEQPDGTYEYRINDSRTSHTSWCGEECMADPVVRRVLERISLVTGFPEENSENLQILRYEKGQQYREHADYIRHHKEKPCGPRALTFFLYLNDEFEGGGTNFRFLWNTTMTPRKGRAVLWPNVVNDDPSKEDTRFDHSAMEVLSGTKYAANAWLHLRDFQSAKNIRCV